jgi:predicted peptidase
MRYLLFEPADYDRRRKYPLVLWLHGGGSRGEDLDLILAHGDKHGPLFLARPDQQKNYPAFVVAPQCPAGRFWADAGADKPSEEMRLVLELLDRLRAEHSIDERRLYVLGISMGGYAAWDIITRRPGMFAAAVPICGGGAESRAGLMTGTAVWAFHGDRDEAVNVSESRRMVAALKKAGAAPRYTEYEGVGHNSWERAFAEPDLLPWLFAQRRK